MGGYKHKPRKIKSLDNISLFTLIVILNHPPTGLTAAVGEFNQ